MDKIKAIIIEDEIEAAGNLKRQLLNSGFNIEVLEILNSVSSAIEWLANENEADLIFMDVELGDGVCFEIFEEVEIKTPIIFTTAYSDYLLRSFDVNNLDYILKPVNGRVLEKGLKKFRSLYASKKVRQKAFEPRRMADFLSGKTGIKSRFLVKTGTRMKVIQAEKINLFLKDDLVCLYAHGRRFIVDQSLDELEKMLDPMSFFRANRQCILNINVIEEVQPYHSGRLYVKINTLHLDHIIVSQRKARPFRAWLDL